MFSFIWAIIIGLIVGAIAKLLMPGRDPSGWIVTILIGIGGSLIMTFIGRQLGFYGDGEEAGFLMSVIGAVLVLAIYRMFKGRSA